MHMSRERGQLVVIDVQQRLAPHIADGEAVVAGCARLAATATRLGVPVTITEHYAKGLGATEAAVCEAAAGNSAVRLEKIAFSCARDEGVAARIDGLAAGGRDQIVVAGMEAHVCVCQSVLSLLADGRKVFLVADAVGSRDPRVRDLAVARMRDAGAVIVAQEMVAFEWLGRGDDPAFKDLIKLIK